MLCIQNLLKSGRLFLTWRNESLHHSGNPPKQRCWGLIWACVFVYRSGMCSEEHKCIYWACDHPFKRCTAWIIADQLWASICYQQLKRQNKKPADVKEVGHRRSSVSPLLLVLCPSVQHQPATGSHTTAAGQLCSFHTVYMYKGSFTPEFNGGRGRNVLGRGRCLT